MITFVLCSKERIYQNVEMFATYKEVGEGEKEELMKPVFK